MKIEGYSCEHPTIAGKPCAICATHYRAATPAPSPRDAAAAIELAYGLLWHISTDNRTWNGLATQTARETLLAQLDRDGQARGITAAKAKFLEFTADPRKNPRTADEAFAKYLPNLDNPHAD
jgi:hypothetical protein